MGTSKPTSRRRRQGPSTDHEFQLSRHTKAAVLLLYKETCTFQATTYTYGKQLNRPSGTYDAFCTRATSAQNSPRITRALTVRPRRRPPRCDKHPPPPPPASTENHTATHRHCRGSSRPREQRKKNVAWHGRSTSPATATVGHYTTPLVGRSTHRCRTEKRQTQDAPTACSRSGRSFSAFYTLRRSVGRSITRYSKGTTCTPR